MLVKELIEALKAFPQDLKVVTKGYEGGYDDITKPRLIQVYTYPEEYWWTGRYRDDDGELPELEVVAIGRTKEVCNHDE
jgi:hypothetical protein